MIPLNAPNENNNNHWENCVFERPSTLYGEEIPDLPLENSEWMGSQMQPYYPKGFETRGFLLRSKKYFCMKGYLLTFSKIAYQ